jgi:hypothetical protein
MKNINKEFQAVFVRFGIKEGKSYLFIAPYDEIIKEGQKVIVEHSDGEEGQAIVVYVDAIDLDYETYRSRWEAYKKIAGNEHPRRVKSLIYQIEYYDEEESEDEEN